MAFIVGEVTARVDADTSEFISRLNSAQSIGANFATKTTDTFNKIGLAIKDIGMGLTKYVSLPLAGVGIAVAKLGMDFETSMSHVVGLVGIAQDQVNAWGQDVLNMSGELGKPPRELAEALYYVTSAGIKGAAAMDVLRMSAKASAAGLGETQVVADMVTSAINAYGAENMTASRATDILVSAVREGKAEASALASTLGSVMPIAAEMGVSFEQVAATTAAMTRTGANAAESTTHLRAILAGLIKPAKQAEEQLHKMGTSSSEMRKKIREDGLLSALMELKDLTNKFGEEAMARVFPNIRALIGVLDLMGPNLEENKKIFDSVANSQGLLNEAFKATSTTMEFRFNQALSTLKANGIKLFETMKSFLVPILEQLIIVVNFLGNKFDGLNDTQKKLIVGFGAIAAAIGPVLLVIGTLISGVATAIGALLPVLASLIAIITVVGVTALTALSGLFLVVASAIAVVTGVIAGLIAAFVHLLKTNEQFRLNVLKTWNIVKENAISIFSEIKETIIVVFNSIREFWKAHGSTIITIARHVWELILGVIRVGTKAISTIIKVVCSLIRGDWSTFFSALRSLASIGIYAVLKIIQTFANLFLKAIANLAMLVIAKFRDLFNSVKGKAKDFVLLGLMIGSMIVQSLTGINFYAAGANIVKQIIAGIKSLTNSVSDAASALAAKIRGFLPFSPAKYGPLKDLDKLNFSGPILASLEKAKAKIKTDFLGNIVLNGLDNKFSAGIPSSMGNSNTSIQSINFYGIQDIIEIMQKMNTVIRRYGGKVIE